MKRLLVCVSGIVLTFTAFAQQEIDVHNLDLHGKVTDLIRDMDGMEHECLVYFPLQQPLESMKLIIDDGASVVPTECPFRHRIAALGSSFTQGAGVTRPGLTWNAQLTRMTGMLFINMGFCGNCKLQLFFAQVLGRSDADATDYKYHDACTDGTHPNDYGYTLWAESICKPVVKILKKYGIK